MLFGCVASVGVVIIILYKWSHGVGIVVDSLVVEGLKIWSRFVCVCALAKSLLYSFWRWRGSLCSCVCCSVVGLYVYVFWLRVFCIVLALERKSMCLVFCR